MVELDTQFAKMNGLGNKIIVADLRGSQRAITSNAAIALAQHDKTHFDQIMEIRDPRIDLTDAYIRIWNSDGSKAGACGNGMRCVVSTLVPELEKTSFTFETDAGIVNAVEQTNGLITVDMGKPFLRWDEIPLAEEFADTRGVELQIGPIDAPILHTPSVVNMGNPHAIFWADRDVWSYEIEKFGPILENHPLFPDRANISIAHVASRTHIIIRTWERGAGLTKACGSAACASLVAAARLDKTDRKATLTLPGGDLEIDWQPNDHVFMTGPIEYEWTGVMDPMSGDWKEMTD